MIESISFKINRSLASWLLLYADPGQLARKPNPVIMGRGMELNEIIETTDLGGKESAPEGSSAVSGT